MNDELNKYFPTPEQVRDLIVEGEKLAKDSVYPISADAIRLTIEAEIVASAIVAFTVGTNATLSDLSVFVSNEFDLQNPATLAGLFRAGNTFAINVICQKKIEELALGEAVPDVKKDACFFSTKIGHA